jgi:2-dehydropantoate 2-reductase
MAGEMRIAVVGAGGTGGYFGGLLARAGEDVTFIARGAHLAAIREHGLTVKSRTVGDFSISPARATDDAASVGPVDLILFCVKTYDTIPAAEACRALVGPETALLSVQNGVDNEERIGAIIGAGHVLGGIAGVSAVIEAPGVVAELGAPAFIRLGELDGGVSSRVERIAETFRHAGITTEALADIRVALWEKFLFICALSGVTALTRLPLGPIRDCPETWALYRGVMEEVAAVGRAEGVALSADVVDRWLAFSGRAPATMYGSMYQDLAAGRRLEVAWLNGTVAQLGARHGIATPLNFAIFAALKPYADGAPQP